MNYFSNIFGLITKYDPTTENGGSFFGYYLVLKLMLGEPITQQDIDLYTQKMEGAHVSKGLYLRSSHHKNRTVSHDELTGMIVTSKILNTYHAGLIVNRIIGGFGSYPATGQLKLYNPADYYAWFTLTNKPFAFLFAANYTINLLISTNIKKQDADSKLNNMVELYLMKDISWYSNLLWGYFVYKMKKNYGEFWVSELFDIYFWSETEEHPILKLSRKIKSEGICIC